MKLNELKELIKDFDDDFIVLIKNQNPSSNRTYNSVNSVKLISSDKVFEDGVRIKEKTKAIVLS